MLDFCRIFGFPKDKCAEVMFEMTRAYLAEKKGTSTLTEIHFTNFDDSKIPFF